MWDDRFPYDLIAGCGSLSAAAAAAEQQMCALGHELLKLVNE